MVGRTVFVVIVSALLLVGAVRPLGAQDAPTEDDPPWIHYAYGLLLLDRGDFGPALVSFRRALAGGLPEAHIGMGLLHMAENDRLLAETSLNNALRSAEDFMIPEYRHTARYALADVYAAEREPAPFQATLETIADEDPHFDIARPTALMAAYLRAIDRPPPNTNGVDQLFVLFRQEEGHFALEAHRRLGIHLTLARDDDALHHLIAGLLKIVTRAVEEIRGFYVDFQFTTVEDFLDYARLREDAWDYLFDSSFFELLYWFAERLYFSSDQGSRRSEALRLFRVLAALDDEVARRHPETGTYRALAERQLQGAFRTPPPVGFDLDYDLD